MKVLQSFNGIEIIKNDDGFLSVRKTPKEETPKLDLNNDGKVDSEDAKIASEVMNEVKKGKRSKR